MTKKYNFWVDCPFKNEIKVCEIFLLVHQL